MVYSKERILLQSAEERWGGKTPLRSLPLPLRVSGASHKQGKEPGRRGGGTTTAVPGPVGASGTNDSEDIVRNERQTVLVLCCLKLGGARGQAERGELVFLQVPGFKKLQAFLHSQAFLQTLGETKDRGRWGTGRERGSGRGAVAARNGLLGGGLVAHAEREHTVMEGGYWRVVP